MLSKNAAPEQEPGPFHFYKSSAALQETRGAGIEATRKNENPPVVLIGI